MQFEIEISLKKVIQFAAAVAVFLVIVGHCYEKNSKKLCGIKKLNKNK